MYGSNRRLAKPFSPKLLLPYLPLLDIGKRPPSKRPQASKRVATDQIFNSYRINSYKFMARSKSAAKILNPTSPLKPSAQDMRHRQDTLGSRSRAVAIPQLKSSPLKNALQHLEALKVDTPKQSSATAR